MNALLLFAATFAVAFTLGLQQLNVTTDRRVLAFITSFAIGISNLVLFKLLPGPTSWLEIAGYLVGGALGIVASMWLYHRLAKHFTQREAP